MSVESKISVHNKAIESAESYDDRAHKVGRISLLVGLTLTFSFPLLLWLKFGLLPDSKTLLTGFVNVSAIMLPSAIIELVSYTPIVGVSGMYIMTLTGNYLNMRLPSAITANEANGLDPSSDKGDVISTIGMVTSVFVSVGTILIGVLLMVPLEPIISAPVLQPAFDTVIMALVGAFTISIGMKNFKTAVFPLVLAFLVIKFNLIPSAIQMPAMIIFSILGNRALYKIGFFN